MKPIMLRVLVVFVLMGSVNSYGDYQAKIPNGDSINHPCKPNFIWRGVGHLQASGGGERNQFGKDFKTEGKRWTTKLCQMDSDGDGISNGVELGDPECTWTPGTVAKHTTGTSHPGVCDPWGSPQCNEENTWVACDGDVFECPAIEETGVLSKDLRFPFSNVPAKDTSYMCVGFDLPSDDDYHMIATRPIINETRVMHHIVLLACNEDSDNITEPQECTMGLRGCTTTIGLWTLGLPGECFYKDAGVRIGTNGFKKAALQFHWTNPEKKADIWDASGLTIYYTKKLRKFDSGVWSTGQAYLEIPPLSPKVVQHSTCSPRCTQKQINGSIFLTTGLNHMHYLGIAEYVKLMRVDGTELMLTDEKHYSYDTPILHQYDPPIEIKPGDRLETVCTYRSMSRKKTAFFGEGTYDEMCFGIFNFFPVDAMQSIINSCITSKEFEYCDFEDWGCKYMEMMNFTHPNTRALIDRVMTACTFLGECQHGCRKVVEDIRTNHNCFKNGIDENFTYKQYLNKKDNDTVEALQFVAAMKSCDCRSENPIDYVETTDDGVITTDDGVITTDDGVRISTHFSLLVFCIMLI